MKRKYNEAKHPKHRERKKTRQEVTLHSSLLLPPLPATAVPPDDGESGLRRTLAPLRQPAPPSGHQDGLVGGGPQTTAQPAGAARAGLAWSLPALLRQAGPGGEPLDGPGERRPRSATAALQDSGAPPWQVQPEPGRPLWDGGPGGGALPGAGPVHGGGGGAEGCGHGVQAAQHRVR